MQNYVALGGRLAIICAVVALVLGLVNAVTAPVIEQNRQEEREESLRRVLGDREVGDREEVPKTEHEVVRAFYPVGRGGTGAGSYVLELTGQGYGGEMRIFAEVRSDGEIAGAVLRENSETREFGGRAENPDYMERTFVGTGAERAVPTTKGALEDEEAEAVSGATITFRGIGEALAAGSRFVEERL
ncbi:MAG: FMN-binding protein [Spirochaetota bacterium]